MISKSKKVKKVKKTKLGSRSKHINSKQKHKTQRQSQRQSQSKLKSKNKPKSKSKSKSYTSIDDSLYDSKELSKFRESKSISIASRLTDIKQTSVGELTDYKPIHDILINQCVEKMHQRRYLLPTSDGSESKHIPKLLATKACSCLFEKNKDLSINELEAKVLNKLETPGSICINVLDKHFEK